jgi:hypothetical protein
MSLYAGCTPHLGCAQLRTRYARADFAFPGPDSEWFGYAAVTDVYNVAEVATLRGTIAKSSSFLVRYGTVPWWWVDVSLAASDFA